MAQTKDSTPDEVMGAGRIESFDQRGVWVPEGLSAQQIMVGAAALEKRFDIDHFLACNMVTTVLQAVSAGEPKEPSDSR